MPAVPVKSVGGMIMGVGMIVVGLLGLLAHLAGDKEKNDEK